MTNCRKENQSYIKIAIENLEFKRITDLFFTPEKMGREEKYGTIET